jgi:hypothetical protein
VENLAGMIHDGRLWCDARRISRNLVNANIGYSHIRRPAALIWLERLGCTVKHGAEIAPGKLAAVVQAHLAPNSVDENGRQRYGGTQENGA